MSEILQIFSAVAFFVIYYKYNIYVASLCLSIFSGIQLLIGRIFKLPNSTLNETSLILLSIFSFATWYFSNALFIQWKITIINFMFAFLLYMYRHFNDVAFFTNTLSASQLKIPNKVGLRADNSLSIFFLFIGIANYYVFTNYSEQVWVYFKTSIVFVNVFYLIFVSLYIHSHIQSEQST